MPALSEPVPIVLIGLSTEMGRQVSQNLLPEYEVIRFIQSFPAAQADLPHLLAGREPPEPPTNDVGTHRYDGRPARAVLLGRAFTPDQAAALREESLSRSSNSAGAEKHPPVAWVVGDPAKKPGGGGAAGPPPGYAGVVAGVAKEILGRWREGGAAEDGIFLY
ncbi:hypothetical protein F4809DRAFT_617632 [Biscogniauxia mediterranea]|nr:hypothetical protein F4809DRAFT_617632 [Biscogniauxia mediterranea]